MIIASNNVNKVREIREIFNDLDFDIVSLKDEDIFKMGQKRVEAETAQMNLFDFIES